MGERERAVEDVAMKFWNHRSVLVTGASGLLGSWLVEELLDSGASVTCLVRDWVPASRLFVSGERVRANIVRGDLVDYETLLRAINEYEVNTVFHLGAQTIVGTAARSPLSTFDANIRGTWTLLEACRAFPRLVDRIVVASSDKAYGAHDRLPYTEDTPLKGEFPYDASKACAELITRSYFTTYKLPVAVTRCGNLFGGGDLNFNRLIPGTIRSVLEGERPVIRSNGQFIRDYFYVRDAVRAYLRLAEGLTEPGVVGEAFNFGTEMPASVLDVVGTILRIMGRSDLEPVILNEASAEIPRQFLDCSKARQTLAWNPTYTFEEGLRETIGWYTASLAAAPEQPASTAAARGGDR